MRFKPEPSYTHGTLSKTALVLVNLGTPAAPTAKALRPYLRQFLSDPRVVEIPRPIWWLILNTFILPFRPAKSAEKYASVWTEQGSPLKFNTERQAVLLGEHLHQLGHELQVVYAMRYGQPGLVTVLEQLKVDGCDRILVFPAYPQYSATTTASIWDEVFSHYQKVRNVPELRLVKHYHDHDAYIEALKESVLAHWETHGQPQKLVMSFHGVPKRTLKMGDPYHCECQKTGRLLAQALGLAETDYIVTFQSRFGKAEWLQPYTEPTLVQLGQQGVRHVDVICPGFTSDCLETLEEVNMEAREEFLAAGGEVFHYIPCLNQSPGWIKALGEIVQGHLVGWPTLDNEAMHNIREQEAQAGRLSALQRGAIE